jgi:hypothetical protein
MVDLLAVNPNQVSVNDVRNKINEILEEGIGGSVYTDPNPPTVGTESDGDLWFDETTGALYVYTDSVNGWVQTNGGGGGGGSPTDPAGADNEVQFNDNGSFGAATNFLYDGGTLTIPRLYVLPQDNANEGGEMVLEKPANSTLAGGVFLDIHIDKLRIFEGGGQFRGAYLDLTECGGFLTSTETNLLSGGAGGSQIETLPTFSTVNLTRGTTATFDMADYSVPSGATHLNVEFLASENSTTEYVYWIAGSTDVASKRITAIKVGNTEGGSWSNIGMLPVDSNGKFTITVTAGLNLASFKVIGYVKNGGERAKILFQGNSGTTTHNIISSHNISSITDGGVGLYYINFTTPILNPILAGGADTLTNSLVTRMQQFLFAGASDTFTGTSTYISAAPLPGTIARVGLYFADAGNARDVKYGFLTVF